MSALPLWSFRRSPYSDIVTRPKPESFKEFLTKLWSEVDRDTTDTQILINSACEKFKLKDVWSLIDYADSRLSKSLQALFLEVTQSFLFKLDRIAEIHSKLTDEINNPVDSSNGMNQCVAMWLMGAYHAAFNETSDFHYLHTSYKLGATLPLFNGEFPDFSSTEIKTESEYKDRVIFSILLNDYQVLTRKAIFALGIFKHGDISEFGNVLRTDASLFGFGESLIYNSMRLVVQQHYSMPTAIYYVDYNQFNPRYYNNTDTLKSISEKHPEFNISDEFDKTYTRMINMLTFTNMSVTGTLNLQLKDVVPRILVTLIKDYQFIEDYLEQYCHETQVNSLKKQLLNACYFAYKDLLQNIAERNQTLDNIELVLFEQLNFFEDLAEQVYGPKNKMVHVIYAVNKCHHAINMLSQSASISDIHYWGGQLKIADEEHAREVFEIAANAGSISAKLQLRIAFNQSKKNTAHNLNMALKWDLEDHRKDCSLGAIGGTYDIIGLFLDGKDNAGELSESIREYIRYKVLKGDLGFPEFVVKVIKEIKEEATEQLPELSLPVDKWSQNTLDEWQNRICKYFPYLRNRMLTNKNITAECALLSLLGELGCPLATVSLNYEANSEAFFDHLAPVCVTLEKLTNPKTMSYYLMIDNWFRYALNFNSLKQYQPKNAIRIVEYLKSMFSTFEELEAHIKSIIDQGEMPSIELTGITINFTQYLMYLSNLFNEFDNAFDRHLHRETSEYIYEFWSKRCALDLNAVSISKLSDFISGRPHQVLLDWIKSTKTIQTFNSRVNILLNPITTHAFLDSIAEFTPEFDTPLGLIYTIYLSYIEKALYAAMEEQNRLECMNVNSYARLLHSLICAHSNVYTDISENLKHAPTTEKKHLGHIDRQGRSKALTAHQSHIDATRKILANTKSIDECVLELKKLVLRGSSYSAQIYHSISTSKLNGREKFMPFDSILLQACMGILSQRPLVEYLNRYQLLMSKPYMCFALFLYDEENSRYQLDEDVRLYLLKHLVHYGDIFAVAYDAHTAAVSADRISMTGSTFEDSIDQLRRITAKNKSLIQLLESAGKNEFSYKFLHSKQKFKIHDIKGKDWMYAFLLSPSADFLSK